MCARRRKSLTHPLQSFSLRLCESATVPKCRSRGSVCPHTHYRLTGSLFSLKLSVTAPVFHFFSTRVCAECVHLKMCRMRRFKDIPPIVWIQRRWYGQDLDLPVSSISSYSTDSQAELRWNRPLIRQQVKPRNVCQGHKFMKRNIHEDVLYSSYMQYMHTQRIYIFISI